MIQMTPCYIYTYTYVCVYVCAYVCMKANGEKIKKVKKFFKKVLTSPLNMVL